MIEQISNVAQPANQKDTRPLFKKKRFLIPAAIFGFAIIAGQFDESKSLTDELGRSSSIKTKQTTDDIANATAANDTTIDKIKKQLKRELASIEKPIEMESYTGSVMSVQIGLALFAVYHKLIQDGKNSLDPDNKKLAEQLEKKVASQQTKAFPQLRKNYANVIAEKLWENDIYVTVNGTNNSIINLTGGLFAANKNVAETQKTLQDILTQLRFKEVRYRWYKDADEFTFYKLDTPKDIDPIEYKQ